MKRIILASGSPRRKQILSDAGFSYEVLKMDVDEDFPEGMDAQQVPGYLATKKMHFAIRQVADSTALVITADTVVILNGRLIGKPENEQDAFRILQELSGNIHTVITAVCMRKGEEEDLILSHTEVHMLPMTDDEIVQYIQSAKPLDKAGAYAIQEWIGMNKINRIEGDYYNVVGFPMSMVYPKLTSYLLEETD